MNHAATSLLLFELAALPAAAQPAASGEKIEQVIVTGERTTEQAVHDFIQSKAAPAPFLGKLARWNSRNPICPSADGFSRNNAAVIIRRVKEIAAEAGAPVSRNAACKTNMAIIATTVPQELMDKIRQERTDLLGYYQSDAQADSLATMHFPIQALYETTTIDANGHIVRDTSRCDPECGGSVAVTGQRARDGLESAFFNVTIVMDVRDIPEHPIAALADYLAMMALAQTGDATPCPDEPSVTSLLSRDCPSSGLVETASATDIAFLKGLYKMDGGGSTTVQRGTIAAEIRKSLEGR